MELVVLTVAKGPNIDHMQRGEVLDIKPDGWNWSALELTRQDLHIIRAPILHSHAQALQDLHTPLHLMKPGQRYPRKSHLLDLDKLPNAQEFAGGRRTQGIVVLQNDDVLNATTKVS